MKKIGIAFCAIALLSLGLLVNTGIVGAYQEGYEYNNYMGTDPVLDGQWTTDDEWNDTATPAQLDGDLNVTFRAKWSMTNGIPVYYIIEFYDDTTEDAEDFWEIIYDGQHTGGDAPDVDDVKIEFVGHDQSGLTFYRGDGEDWVESTAYSWEVDLFVVDSISSSPSDSNPHYIAEVMVDHGVHNLGPDQVIRVSAYDASNSEAGEQAWPDSSPDNPEEWGALVAFMEPIPEGLTFAVMVFLSSVSLLVGSQYLKSRSKKREE